MYRLWTLAETVTLVVTLMAHGCPAKIMKELAWYTHCIQHEQKVLRKSVDYHNALTLYQLVIL